MPDARKTAISNVEAERITIRGYEAGDLIGNLSFGSGIYLILKGERPTGAQAKLFESILISVIDHGVRPPSTIAATTVANTGASLNAGVAAGILAINKFHGGAIEDAMLAIKTAVDISEQRSGDIDEAAAEMAAGYKSHGKRVSGFGHRLHAADPRTVRLFAYSEELGLAGKYVDGASAIERVLTKNVGRPMPVNADGAIAALLLELDFPPKAANGIFMIARVPGLVAHVVEEQERNPPMRTVDVNNYEYDGPTGLTL